MRQLNIFLGAITVGIAVWLAREGLWWIAVPDGVFGFGVAWVAWVSIQQDRPAPIVTKDNKAA